MEEIMIKRSFLFSVLALFLFSTQLVSCGGGGAATVSTDESTVDGELNFDDIEVEVGESGNNFFGDAQAAAQETLDIILFTTAPHFPENTVESDASSLAKFAVSTGVSETCYSWGKYSISGNYNTSSDENMHTYDYMSVFDDCNALDGQISHSGSFDLTYYESDENLNRTYNLPEVEVTLNGKIGAYGCEVEFHDFQYSVEYNKAFGYYDEYHTGRVLATCRDDYQYDCQFDEDGGGDATNLYVLMGIGEQCQILDPDGEEITAGTLFFGLNQGDYTLEANSYQTDPDGNRFKNNYNYTIRLRSDGSVILFGDDQEIVFNFDSSSSEVDHSTTEPWISMVSGTSSLVVTAQSDGSFHIEYGYINSVGDEYNWTFY
jgi:hypothetical protein